MQASMILSGNKSSANKSMSMFPNPQDSSCCQDKSSSCAMMLVVHRRWEVWCSFNIFWFQIQSHQNTNTVYVIYMYVYLFSLAILESRDLEWNDVHAWELRHHWKLNRQEKVLGRSDTGCTSNMSPKWRHADLIFLMAAILQYQSNIPHGTILFNQEKSQPRSILPQLTA